MSMAAAGCDRQSAPRPRDRRQHRWSLDRPDPLRHTLASAAVEDAGLADQVSIRLGVAEDLVEEPAGFDIVWCRDVIEVLPDLTTALAQMRRVMRPGGHLIVFTNLLEGPIEATETASIHQPLGNVVANLVEADLEDAFAAAGFIIKIKHVIGTEWREYLEEHDQVCVASYCAWPAYVGAGPRRRPLRARRLSHRRGKSAVRSPPVPRGVRAGHRCPRRYLVPLKGRLAALRDSADERA